MMGMIWVVLLVALTGSHLGHCSPLRSTPQTYPHDAPRSVEGWGPEGSVYAAVPALALVLTAVGLLFGCTWCYRHKDCKPNEGADNQLFTASATHLHDGRRAHPPDSGFSEPVNNNISEDNNNGPISLREMQNIANNNAAAYIVSENEERNRVSRESVVEFEPLPTGIRVADPLEHCADWFGDDDFPRDQLQYLREIGRGWFGRVVEGEIEDSGATTPVAVKILNQNASLEDKARFLDEARMYRDVRHENVLAFLAKCLQEEPWILLFELCSMDLQQYLVVNRPKMAILNDSGVPLRIMCDVTAALAHLHSRGYLYGSVWSGAVQVRGSGERARAMLGRYCSAEPPRDFAAPETRTHPPVYTASSDLWSLGTLVWEVCAWGAAPTRHPPPLPDLPCPYRNHLYQVMQLCWNPSPEARPTSAQVHALIHHLYATPRAAEAEAEGAGGAPARHSADFEQRWQRLKPNNIPTRDEHRALVHAHAHAHAHPPPDDALGAVSRSSSIMSDKEPLDAQIKSESLTNLHGSLEDVRNIYLTHNELAALDCHQGNIALDDAREREQDRSDASVDPWLKDIIAGSQDDVSYYKDVSDVIKNLDNILNSEKTSSSESSHQASPSRDNLSLDCKKDYPMQSSMVKSPGITNFQNILDTGFSTKEEDETGEDDEIDRDTIGTLSHSFERHSEVDTTSQHTLENLTPDTPIKDVDIVKNLEIQVEVNHPKDYVVDNVHDIELPNEIVSSVSEIPKLKELCVASIPSASDKQFVRKDCQTSCDSNLKSTDYKEETKSIDDVVKVNVTPHEVENKKNKDDLITEVVNDIVLPKTVDKITSTKQESHDNLPDVKEDSKVIDEGSMTNDVSIAEVLASDLIKEKPEINCLEEDRLGEDVKDLKSEQTPVSVQNKNNLSTNTNIKETETPFVLKEEKTAPLPPEIVQNKFKEENDVEKAVAVGNIIPDDTIAKESIVKQEASDEIIAAEDMTEEDLISDHEVNDYEKNTVSEVTEYTKWINCASTPERVQEVSDISRLKHDLIAKRKHARHEHTFKSVNDNDFEVIIQKECLEAPVAESLKISDSKDFLEDPLVKDSLKEGNEVLSEEMTGEIEIPVKESELVDTAEINYSTKQDENDFFESKLITETPSTSEKCEHTLIEVTETISDNSDNDLTEIIGNNKSDLDYINLEKQANKPLVLVPSFPMKSVKDDLGFKNTEIKENSIGTVTKGKVNIVFEEPSVYKSIELDQDIVTGEDDSDKSPVKELTKFQQYISVDSTDKPVVEQLEHISDVHSAEKPIIKQLQVTDDILEQLQRIGEVHSTEKRIVEQPQHTSDVHTIEEPIIEQLLHTSVVHSTEKPIVEELEHTDVVKSTEKLIVEELQHTDEDNSTQISIVETLQYTDVVHLTVKPIVHEQQHTDVAHSTEELIVKEQQHTDVIHSTEKPIVEELPHTDVVHSTEALIVEELQHTDVVHSTEKPIIEELPHTDVVHSTEALIVEELQHTDVVHSTEKPIVEELPHTDVVHSTEALIVEELQHTDVVHSIEKPIVEELPHTDVVHSTEALIVEEIKHTDVVHSTEKPIGEELQHTDVVHSTEEPIIEELQQIDVANSTEKPIGEELQLNSDGYSTVKELQHVGHSTVKPVVEERKHTGDFHSTEKPVVEQLVPAQIEQPMIEETILDEVVDINATDKDTSIHIENKDTHRSEDTLAMERSDDSTAYMDLINNTNSEILTNDSAVDKTVRDVIKSCLETSTTEKVCYLDNNESTEYLDLPSFGIKDVDNFLHMEKVFSSNIVDVVASTPLTSDTSANTNNTLESSVKDNSESQILFETKVPNYGPGVSLTKLEQKYVPDSLSPFESPTKSHPTDTYDENSSVVLGPFENCTLDLFKGVKSTELVDLPKEELLAFSSNFSDINLETPSPLRDGNFLNEVPDIIHDDLQFDDVQSLSEKPPSDPTETESINSGTEKRVSPSTPPNSPGIFLASTSQQKYVVDIDLTPEVMAEPDLSLQKEIELNQIELQITSKLAMAENENNMNIEYSGPLTVEGLVSEEGMMLRESDALPESYLAGNGGSMEDLREDLTLDEECVKALRNELELKLPLAQVAAIEPPCESTSAGAWSGELPPPPELVLSYPGALSPIAEETGQQLSAYENDIHWNLSTRTDSSESYPEPCNNSTDEVTELPTGANSGLLEQSTYTIHSRDQSRDQSQNNTYTLHRDIASSREITMSADSLNASPFKKPIPDPESPIDDKTYTKEEEKESLERISQVSPFLLSPTTDTSAPDNSDNLDNATGVSTLSKTTLPTDAKLSKPSETQCLSKATSIDSWCSNDTLYNVEENFDDLAMDPEVPDFEPEKEEGNSESTDTLTHNEDEKEASHCSTYIIHDSKSEICETFSPDSITANDNYTYTKAKTENAGTTPSVLTTELNDSTKNTQTKDLAYGTLMSGLPSYSNCTTDLASGFDDWKVQQPELVRKSPMINNGEVTPSNASDEKVVDITSPHLDAEPSIKRMESVDISCLQENLTDNHNKTEVSESQGLLVHIDSPNYNYKNMAPSITSTPITDLIDNYDVETIPMILPEANSETVEDSVTFQTFLQSAEVRPQDLSSNASNEANQDTEILLEGDSKTLSRNSNRDSLAVSERTPTYSDFENSAISKPQDVNSKDKSSQSNESGISSADFQKFESLVRSRPQDLSSLIDASSLLLKSERMSSELAMGSIPSDHEQTSQETNEESQQSPPNVTNLNESHSLVNFREPIFLLNFDADDETEQPHSIIITETTMEAFKESPNRTYDTDKLIELNQTYDTQTSKIQHDDFEKLLEQKINGEITKPEENKLIQTALSPRIEIVAHNSNTDIVADIKERQHTSLPTSSSDFNEMKAKEGSEKFATVNFLNETFEELIESNVDDSEPKEPDTEDKTESLKSESLLEVLESPKESKSIKDELLEVGVLNGVSEVNEKLTTVTEDFLQNEKKFCQFDTYLPLLSDIRFTGPASEIMSTSFTQESPTSPTEPTSPTPGACTRVAAADIIKEWDSDSDSHTSNSSSGEFIWKDGDGHETAVVPTTHFDHQRTGESQGSGCTQRDGSDGGAGSGASDASGDSGSGSEGDEVEFVPSSWDCRAAPAKSSLRSLEQATPVGDNKKRVVFKRQKYHCVYEYPREAADLDAHSPAAYLPDLSTYSEWDPSSVEEAELGYGQLFGAPSPLDLYPLRAGIAFGADYDEDFFISSSARPFESLGIMTSQFFPGKHVKPSLLERDLSDDVTEDFPPPPSPLPTTTLMQTRTPSLDFTTPDSGVEDITPGSTTDEDFKKKLPESELTWRPVDSGSSSESVSPSSPGGEALGGLRHTRDKLKLDLPPSPHIPSPRHNRVFNFVLDKPKRRDERTEMGSTPLVMTDDTPIVTTALPLNKECEDLPVPEPTFSTFGKSAPKVEPEQKLILTDEVEESTTEVKDESPSPKVVEAVKGEGTVLDSGDEDSGIESSSKATLERNKTNVS